MSYFIEGSVGDGVTRNTKGGKKIPDLSTRLDSIRAYQWEITFHDIPEGVISTPGDKPLTLAAKQVSQTGFQVEEIEAHRGNDRFYYPGKPSMDELVVTFDNTYYNKTAKGLFEYMRDTYDPETGEMQKNHGFDEAGPFKTMIDVTQVDGKGKIVSNTRYIGCFMKAWKLADWNYSTNDFHTVECTFRYDFIHQSNTKP